MKSHKKEDKAYLQSLCEVLKISQRRMMLDECGDWNIVGRRGIISTDSDNFYMYVSPPSRIKWNNIKKRLSWMDVTQDGDEEGILRSNLCMSEKQAAQIRKEAGLTFSPPLTEEQREILRRRFFTPYKTGVSQSHIDLNEVGATHGA